VSAHHVPGFAADPRLASGTPEPTIPRKRLTLLQQNEAKSFALEIVRSEEYRHSVRVRAQAGTLPPAIEQMIWYYAYGKPVDKIQVVDPRAGLGDMTPEELSERAELIKQVISLKIGRKGAEALSQHTEQHLKDAGVQAANG